MSILLTTTCNTIIILKLQIIKKKYLKIPKMPEGDIFFLAFNLRVSKKVSFQVRVTVWWQMKNVKKSSLQKPQNRINLDNP